MPPQFSPRFSRAQSRSHNQIRRYRLALGLTQRDVATHLKIEPSTFSSWERGLTCPPGKYLLRLAKALSTMSEALYPETYREEETIASRVR
jgi:transcriptional regulator with XRE-family HTH domain